MSAYTYPIALAILSVAVALAERFFPWRPEQKQLRRTLFSDLLHLVFNGHFLGVILFGIATYRVLPHVDSWLSSIGLRDSVYLGAASDWPLWVQIPFVLLVLDFVQWCIHVSLHRIPLLWRFHQTHHSVVDGEMDWIVSFRFQWTEVVVYKTVQYLPLAFFGFAPTAIMVHAIFGTLIGHLNHSNLDLGRSWIRYVFNTPRMHIWHHDYDRGGRTTVNFGIIFSIWDWLFGTAAIPAEAPRRIGFRGVEAFPKTFFGQTAWPLGSAFAGSRVGRIAGGLIGVAILAGGAWLAQPPSVDPRAEFGLHAKRAGFRHPEHLVSVDELRGALDSDALVLLDARPFARAEEGHIEGAQPVWRPDWSTDVPVPGTARDARELRALLEVRGADDGDSIVLYGDGGPEPFRLWWLMKRRLGVDARILDGGLDAWKAAGLPVVTGLPERPAPGELSIHEGHEATNRWADVAALRETHGGVLVDGRSPSEFTGAVVHPDVTRGGHVPGALNLEWTAVQRSADDKRLADVETLRRRFEAAGVTASADEPIVAMCQSGTRSAALLFGLHQVGVPMARLHNYDGSWAEYHALELPDESCAVQQC